MASEHSHELSLADLVERARAAQQAAERAHHEAYGDAVPYTFFPGPWCFGPDNLGLSREELIETVRHTDEEWASEDDDPERRPWDPDEVVLSVGRVVILYDPDPPGEVVRFRAADLRSDNGESFTAGEILYKFYACAAADLQESMHRQLQGFQFLAWVTSAVPVYQVWLGS